MEHTDCPVCAAKEQQELWTRDGARYVRCPQCSLVYEDPRLTPAELEDFYSQESYFMPAGEKSPNYGYQNYLAQCSPALQDEYFTIVTGAARVSAGRYLDVGCGAGGVVATARSKGWDAVGQEISGWAAAEAQRRGIPVVKGDLLETGFPSGHFDAVSMFDVLEHLPAPGDYVREVFRILRPGGVLVIETPNIDGFFARYLYRASSDLVRPRSHICLYSPRSIRRLLESAPFAQHRISTFPYCRTYGWPYAKALVASRLLPGRTLVQLTVNESLRVVCWK